LARHQSCWPKAHSLQPPQWRKGCPPGACQLTKRLLRASGHARAPQRSVAFPLIEGTTTYPLMNVQHCQSKTLPASNLLKKHTILKLPQRRTSIYHHNLDQGASNAQASSPEFSSSDQNRRNSRQYPSPLQPFDEAGCGGIGGSSLCAQRQFARRSTPSSGLRSRQASENLPVHGNGVVEQQRATDEFPDV